MIYSMCLGFQFRSSSGVDGLRGVIVITDDNSMDYMFPELVGGEKKEGFLFKKSLF